MDLAREAGAKVTVVTVIDPFRIFAQDLQQLSETKASVRLPSTKDENWR